MSLLFVIYYLNMKDFAVTPMSCVRDMVVKDYGKAREKSSNPVHYIVEQ